jgi:N,N'-diacetyllegionaminate synthase
MTVRRIGDTSFGHDHVFVIAEAGVNHNGDITRALEMVDIASDCGADGIKFQSFNTEKLVTKNAPTAAYQQENTGDGNQYNMLKSLELTLEQQRRLQMRCAEKDIVFLSTPFEEESADLLDGLSVPAYKISSGEITNLPFLAHVARKGRPIILSSGMANLGEVENAVRCIEKNGNNEIILLHCVSNYPADPAEVNLLAMQTLQMAFGYPVGYSDHTLGSAVSIASVALGAVMIEKHFTLSRELPGPDHVASLEPDELKQMIADIRAVSSAFGDGIKRRKASEENAAQVVRKSLVTTRPLKAGDVIDESSLRSLRPGNGISPTYIHVVVGRNASRDIEEGSMLSWNDLI